MDQRQTDLSLKQILDFLNNGSSYPDCLLLNELGLICRNGQDEDETGEKYLLSTLEDEDRSKRTIAFCCLSLVPGAKEKHATALADFRNKPENKESLSFIDRSLARYN
ncbi:MAG: hypothetical protein WAW11_00315 [Patescibacteria group bacterium]